jgi:hypothetical protein
MDYTSITITGFSLLLITIFSYITIQVKKMEKNWPMDGIDKLYTDHDMQKITPLASIPVVFDRIGVTLSRS